MTNKARKKKKSWRVLNTVENLSWPKVHQIWKRKSGKQGRKYLVKCLTWWEIVWSKIFDLKKEVFACDCVRLQHLARNP